MLYSEYTTSLLYDAQRRMIMCKDVPTAARDTRVAATRHNAPAVHCEDCDRPLAASNDAAWSLLMEGDSVIEDYSCRCCGRRVCDLCAHVADERRCLQCATMQS